VTCRRGIWAPRPGSRPDWSTRSTAPGRSRRRAPLATEVDRVLEPLPQLSTAGRAIWRVQRAGAWQFGLLVPLAEIVVLSVAGLGVASGRTTAADLVAVIGYLALAASAMNQLDIVFQLAQVRASAAPLAEILARPIGPDGQSLIPAGAGEVIFGDVTVVRGGEAVLDGFSLTIPAGASVALVGRSGAGKSTAAQLVGRLVTRTAAW
jgi:ATP-binding cassette subfamily B protein